MLKIIKKEYLSQNDTENMPKIESFTEEAKDIQQHFKLFLPIINHKFDGLIIRQRIKDGYIEANSICSNDLSLFLEYNNEQQTKKLLLSISDATSLKLEELIHYKSGQEMSDGIWLHPYLAVDLVKKVYPSITLGLSKLVSNRFAGKIDNGNLPYHLRNCLSNTHRVPRGYFSIFNEINFALISPVAQMGYAISDDIINAISKDTIFSEWLLEKGYNQSNVPLYDHLYEDGKTLQIKAYPKELWTEFQKYLIEDWMPNESIQYFESRDPNLAKYIEKLLLMPDYKDIAGLVEG